MSNTIPSKEMQMVTKGRRETSLTANWQVFAITLYMGVALFEYSFNKGTITSILAMSRFLQIITLFMILGSVIGSLLTGFVSAHISCQYGLMLGSVIVIICVMIILKMAALGALYFSRLFIMISIGLLLNFTCSTCRTAHLLTFRDSAWAWSLAESPLAMIRMVINLPTVSRVESSPAILILTLTLLFFPKSPCWLLQHKKPEAEFHSLQFFWQGTDQEIHQNKWLLFFKLFRGHHLRRTVIVFTVSMSNAAVGAMFILSYGTYFFQVANVGDLFK
ncbi:hypothetical protein BDW72DRAFT_199381 [Aspergillus terricola var. indicus]